MTHRWRWTLALALLAAAVAGAAWWSLPGRDGPPPGVAVANGRIEATEVQVATKLPGRIDEILVDEGDSVQAGQVVARMDTQELEARLHEAQAQVTRHREARKAAEALVDQRDSQCAYAQSEHRRIRQLMARSHTSEDALDRARADAEAAEAACRAARAQRLEAEAGIEAARAAVERIEAELADAALHAPRGGRVLFRLAEPGEVLAAGGRLLTLVDLDDVYMIVYLPTARVGKIPVGAEARLLLDALPDRPVKARVSFVADEAQFTPKHVETREERQKLMFRVKVRALENPQGLLKPGMPGLAYIRQSDAETWPPEP
mgnify:CR=1 FL=1